MPLRQDSGRNEASPSLPENHVFLPLSNCTGTFHQDHENRRRLLSCNRFNDRPAPSQVTNDAMDEGGVECLYGAEDFHRACNLKPQEGVQQDERPTETWGAD